MCTHTHIHIHLHTHMESTSTHMYTCTRHALEVVAHALRRSTSTSGPCTRLS
jgi:hypothetical protein